MNHRFTCKMQNYKNYKTFQRKCKRKNFVTKQRFTHKIISYKNISFKRKNDK